MNNPINVMLAVASAGGRMCIDGENIQALLPSDRQAELKAGIKRHKQGLLLLLRMNFLIVQSDVTGGMLLWVPDAMTKDLLLDAGADASIIYTPDDLSTLVNRRVTVGELAAIHEARRVFNGRIAP